MSHLGVFHKIINININAMFDLWMKILFKKMKLDVDVSPTANICWPQVNSYELRPWPMWPLIYDLSQQQPLFIQNSWTDSDAYEPTVQYAHVGSITHFMHRWEW